MVYYFVIGADGNRYGPADIDALVQWAREGRIVGSTMLVERGTERSLRADGITAINAELFRLSGSPNPVVVERGPNGPSDAPTITRAGPMNWNAPASPQAHGGPPPVPTMPYGSRQMVSHRSRLAAGLLGIFLGGIGVHRFYMGYIGIGIIQILVTIISCGYGAIWGFVEGIICLSGGMRDADGLELRD